MLRMVDIRWEFPIPRISMVHSRHPGLTMLTEESSLGDSKSHSLGVSVLMGFHSEGVSIPTNIHGLSPQSQPPLQTKEDSLSISIPTSIHASPLPMPLCNHPAIPIEFSFLRVSTLPPTPPFPSRTQFSFHEHFHSHEFFPPPPNPHFSTILTTPPVTR